MINYSIPLKYILQCRNENVADFIVPGDKSISVEWSEDGKSLIATMKFANKKSASFSVPVEEVDCVYVPAS